MSLKTFLLPLTAPRLASADSGKVVLSCQFQFQMKCWICRYLRIISCRYICGAQPINFSTISSPGIIKIYEPNLPQIRSINKPGGEKHTYSNEPPLAEDEEHAISGNINNSGTEPRSDHQYRLAFTGKGTVPTDLRRWK